MNSINHMISSLVLGSVILLLAACGGGQSTAQNPDLSIITQSTYTGPPPATQDVLLFQSSVWDGLKDLNRCGSCHVEGDQAPMFVRQDDVNAAYTAANSVVNLADPDQSLLVTKVAAGHNCWLPSNAACGVAVAAYIDVWANGSAGSTKTIALKAPATLNDPGSSKTFPLGSSGFGGIHSLLTQHCQQCHIESSATPQSPFFASLNIDEAYEAAKPTMNLNLPDDSRLVVRLRDEFHNCWDDCASDSAELLSAINNFANGITADVVDPQLLYSKAMGLSEGIVASGGSRYEDNVVALYEFKSGVPGDSADGMIAIDTSGVPPALDLSVSGDISWVGGWGIQIQSGKAQGSTTASKKLTDLIRATGEYSVEAWIAPANVTQEDARIISYSGSTTTRNFTLGQTLYNYDFLNRNGNSDANGEPSATTDDGDEILQATLQHVVATYDPVNGRRIYVNGVLNGDPDTVAPSNLNDWDNSFAFVLGNEVSNDRQWQGTIRMLAIHNRALSAEQIVQNFEVGVGEKFFLLFNVDAYAGIADSYVVFEVSQYDSYSYLFSNPLFIVLGDNPVAPQSLPLQGMRIGVNGKEVTVGQAYKHLDLIVGGIAYSAETGQSLSSVATIIGLENGPLSDEFFLTFEQLGGSSNVVTEPSSPVAGISLEPDTTTPEIGLRTFDEVNATMSELTGVSVTQANVQSTYNLVRQQLPTTENISSFLSAHQVGVSQLSIEYCNAMVDDSLLRDLFFIGSGFNGFGDNVATAFPDNTAKIQVVEALYHNMIGASIAAVDPVGNSLSTAPTLTDIEDVLINGGVAGNGQSYTALFTSMASNCGSCDADSTDIIIKGMCAAVLGSAAMLIQ